MPSNTLYIYNDGAKAYSDRYDAMTPTRSYELAEQFFKKGRPTLDIGCGTGRDTEYLSAHGFPTTGTDGSTGMLKEARARRPACTFIDDSLPLLSGQKSSSIANIFCSAVVMHLSEATLAKSAINMLRILQPKGRAVFSFRGPGTAAADGNRLFMRYTTEQVGQFFSKFGGTVLLEDSVNRGTVPWHYLVVEKA